MDSTSEFIEKLLPQDLPWLQGAWQEWQQRMQNRMGHAYLIQSAEGLGVEVLVNAIAKLRLCHSPRLDPETQILQACQQCHSCHLFSQNQHPDFYHLQLLEDKKEISIAQIRELIDKQNQTSHQGGYKVIWVEKVESLSISAFNALLKSLEEPADNTLFLLTTAQVFKLPATIRSRCQKLNITQPALDDSLQWLAGRLPQQDQALLKKALRVNWSSPLKAYSWIHHGLFNEERQWNEALQAVVSGQKNLSKVVQAWLAWPRPENAFDYFYLWVLGKIRKIGYHLESLPEPESTQAKVTLQQWLRFQQALGLAKQDWQGNANRELVLENVFMEWLKLTQLEQTGSLSGYSYQSVFQSNVNRGSL